MSKIRFKVTNKSKQGDEVVGNATVRVPPIGALAPFASRPAESRTKYSHDTLASARQLTGQAHTQQYAGPPSDRSYGSAASQAAPSTSINDGTAPRKLTLKTKPGGGLTLKTLPKPKPAVSGPELSVQEKSLASTIAQQVNAMYTAAPPQPQQPMQPPGPKRLSLQQQQHQRQQDPNWAAKPKPGGLSLKKVNSSNGHIQQQSKQEPGAHHTHDRPTQQHGSIHKQSQHDGPWQHQQQHQKLPEGSEASRRPYILQPHHRETGSSSAHHHGGLHQSSQHTHGPNHQRPEQSQSRSYQPSRPQQPVASGYRSYGSAGAPGSSLQGTGSQAMYSSRPRPPPSASNQVCGLFSQSGPGPELDEIDMFGGRQQQARSPGLSHSQREEARMARRQQQEALKQQKAEERLKKAAMKAHAALQQKEAQRQRNAERAVERSALNLEQQPEAKRARTSLSGEAGMMPGALNLAAGALSGSMGGGLDSTLTSPTAVSSGGNWFSNSSLGGPSISGEAGMLPLFGASPQTKDAAANKQPSTPQGPDASGSQAVAATQLAQPRPAPIVKVNLPKRSDSPLVSGAALPPPDKRVLMKVLDQLQKKDKYGIFAKPVTEEVVSAATWWNWLWQYASTPVCTTYTSRFKGQPEYCLWMGTETT